MDYSAFVGLPALIGVIPFLVTDIKNFARAIEDRKVGSCPSATPWPLVADTLGAAAGLAAWAANWIPQEQIDSPLAAGLIGLVAGITIQKTYSAVDSR